MGRRRSEDGARLLAAERVLFDGEDERIFGHVLRAVLDHAADRLADRLALHLGVDGQKVAIVLVAAQHFGGVGVRVSGHDGDNGAETTTSGELLLMMATAVMSQ